MKYIWELQNSINILDRQNFVKRIKVEVIPKIIARIGRLEKEDEYEVGLEKRFLIGLKNLLSNYDIYNQKIESRCRICQETECVCYALEEKSIEEEIKTLF